MDEPLDLETELGAAEAASVQVLSVYVPSQDREGKPFDSAPWRAEALRLLSDIGGGATAMPPAEGAWLNEETGNLVIEPVTIVYTYVRAAEFRENLGKLRAFLHRMGRRTDQGEVAFEFDGRLYRIREYDE